MPIHNSDASNKTNKIFARPALIIYIIAQKVFYSCILSSYERKKIFGAIEINKGWEKKNPSQSLKNLFKSFMRKILFHSHRNGKDEK